MAWYNEAIFYHIYPLGLTGAEKLNEYKAPVSRINKLYDWVNHIKSIGFDALYIGPLCESVGHGYETTDYKKLDSRLGTNDDLKKFIKHCHDNGVRVIFDGVFNHTGRDFFAFKDIQKNRENSPYKDWYNVNFWGNNSYNDGFSYENWGGFDLLVKFNQKNPAVIQYICDVIRYWVSEFDIDGIRLDAADVLDFNFMKALRVTANEVKPDFWLMGEVIHGAYNRWANDNTLHSVTNYHLHKALYSGHNDKNYFEIAHTVKRLLDMDKSLKLYNFTDNHDVERIYTKLSDKRHFVPCHILLFTLPGIPSVYYGSELGIEGRKERHSDDSLRPCLDIKEYKNAAEENACTKLIKALCKIKKATPQLSYGEYKELLLTNRQYAFGRTVNGKSVITAVNNDDKDCTVTLPCSAVTAYKGALSGKVIKVSNSTITVTIRACSGDIFIPEDNKNIQFTPVEAEIRIEENPGKKPEIKAETKPESKPKAVCEKKKETAEKHEKVCSDKAKPVNDDLSEVTVPDKPYEEMTVQELQAAILEKLSKNGPVTEQMKKDVKENIWHNSLINWVKSFG